MDLDLRRCRRTDGKKWRCKREVVANEKYCESHMHRGRDRSRKLVEISDHLAANSDAAILINLKRGGNLKTNCPVKIRSPKDVISDDKAVMNAAKNKSKENAAVKFLIRSSTSNDAAASRKKECSPANDGDVRRRHHFIDVPKDDSGNTVTKNVNAAVSTNSEFEFSPKSVLRGESSRQNRNLANTVESEPGRCRRTDGKKWRCRKDVLPDQKYCEAHVHRGSKRRILPSQVAPDSTSTAPSFKANLAKSGGVGSSSNAACSVDSSDTNASTDVSELSTTSECQ